MASLKASIPAIAAPRTRSTSATSRGVGRLYQQTFIGTYSKVACAKLYDRKTPITAADLFPGRDAGGEGEDDRSLTISDTKPDRSTRHACQIEFRLIQMEAPLAHELCAPVGLARRFERKLRPRQPRAGMPWCDSMTAAHWLSPSRRFTFR
jgi:hypothetical protein